MNVYTIVLERIGTGEPSLSIVTRQDNEAAAGPTPRRQLRNHRTCGSWRFMPDRVILLIPLRGGTGRLGCGVENSPRRSTTRQADCGK
jgi:hypothetical protein